MFEKIKKFFFKDVKENIINSASEKNELNPDNVIIEENSENVKKMLIYLEEFKSVSTLKIIPEEALNLRYIDFKCKGNLLKSICLLNVDEIENNRSNILPLLSLLQNSPDDYIMFDSKENRDVCSIINKKLLQLFEKRNDLLSDLLKFYNGYKNPVLIKSFLDSELINDNIKKRIINNICNYIYEPPKTDYNMNMLSDINNIFKLSYYIKKYKSEHEVGSLFNKYNDSMSYHFRNLSSEPESVKEINKNIFRNAYLYSNDSFFSSLHLRVDAMKMLHIDSKEDLKMEKLLSLYNAFIDNKLEKESFLSKMKALELVHHDFLKYKARKGYDIFDLLKNKDILLYYGDSREDINENKNKDIKLFEIVELTGKISPITESSFFVNKLDFIMQTPFDYKSDKKEKDYHISIVKGVMRHTYEGEGIMNSVKVNLNNMLSNMDTQKEFKELNNILDVERGKLFIQNCYKKDFTEGAKNTLTNKLKNIYLNLQGLDESSLNKKINIIINKEFLKYKCVIDERKKYTESNPVDDFFEMLNYFKSDTGLNNYDRGINGILIKEICELRNESFKNIDPLLFTYKNIMEIKSAIRDESSAEGILNLFRDKFSDEQFEILAFQTKVKLIEIEFEKRVLNDNLKVIIEKEPIINTVPVNTKRKRL